ncbi:aminotransferase class I/II-fold pyridoxal phosphate-dependent enzyme [candidate division KSB3 bacterium]|uniref:Aminotransferase class I/II-fold pyridoxal phosphate-dependent enzyme n=1 Tax=candidate division KSB3 bacterium TaxID=2044937 RepID=A0A9D5JZN5_9BACT|nr:aminotransferase class I/II-fold pyridoxal phosphate-dependent enzyme [candidate division KSB3 bacterium]MBD3326975.1 aminotransferase class I/II-fold pyridoxal phosphate-dependent enzyme [candidate division KSB3 bacterium]
MPGPGFEWIGKEEEAEVLEVLRAHWLFRYGDVKDPHYKHKVVTLEEEFCKKFGVKHALAVTSGTSALIVALNAAGVGPGDEVIVPGYTFIASMSSVIMARAVPILAEVDESMTLDPKDVEQKITPRTKAIMAVHMIGNPCDLEKLQAIADKHNLLLIEDTAQAFGGSYRGKRLGTLGDVGTYSFNIYKTINAGDGGMVATDDDEMYYRAFGYHDQGHFPMRTGVEIGNRSIIGQNFRMNELTGAFVLAQFRKTDQILNHLREIKAKFKQQIQGLKGVEFRRINDPDGECGTLVTVFLPDKQTADAVAAKLNTVTVSHSGWHVYSNMEQILGKKTLDQRGCPFYCDSFPTEVEYKKGMLPQTDDLLARAINISVGVIDKGLGSAFGIHPHISDAEIDQKAEQFRKAVQESI